MTNIHSADFSLSKTGLVLDQTYPSTTVRDSLGYLDPEYSRQQLREIICLFIRSSFNGSAMCRIGFEPCTSFLGTSELWRSILSRLKSLGRRQRSVWRSMDWIGKSCLTLCLFFVSRVTRFRYSYPLNFALCGRRP
jgi:hypothetical protein